MLRAGGVRYLEVPASGSGRVRGTLVLVHAFPLHAGLWEPQRFLAAQGWRVIMPHLRGLGPESSGPPVTSIDDYAADIIDLMDALHIEGAVLGGLSLGGYVVFALLRLAPAYIQGLLLADTRPQADAPAALESRQRMLDLVEAKGAAAVVDDMLPKLVGETTRRERPEVVNHVADMIRSNRAEGIAGAVRAMMSRPDSTTLLSSIRCPTLVVVGDEDTLTPPSISEEMANAISGARLAVIGRAGHLSNLEEPEAFNASVSAFLSVI